MVQLIEIAGAVQLHCNSISEYNTVIRQHAFQLDEVHGGNRCDTTYSTTALTYFEPESLCAFSFVPIAASVIGKWR